MKFKVSLPIVLFRKVFTIVCLFLGVIHVYDYFENDDHWILVLERLRNCQDLFDYLESRDRGRLSEVMAKKFFLQLIQINLAMMR